MNELPIGFALGLAGSVHCLAMCGPLVLTVRSGIGHRAARFGVLYQTGRVLTYAALGVGAGALGHAITSGGAGRALSIAAGAFVLLAAVGPWQRWRASRAIGRVVGGILQRVGRARAMHPNVAALAMGTFNALLPCGLVYVAVTTAAALGSVARGAGFMLMFGLGTAPALGAVWIAPPTLPLAWRRRLRYATPIAMVLVGILLIARGAGMPAPASHVHAGSMP